MIKLFMDLDAMRCGDVVQLLTVQSIMEKECEFTFAVNKSMSYNDRDARTHNMAAWNAECEI